MLRFHFWGSSSKDIFLKPCVGNPSYTNVKTCFCYNSVMFCLQGLPKSSMYCIHLYTCHPPMYPNVVKIKHIA
jgi:hypothetical protein